MRKKPLPKKKAEEPKVQIESRASKKAVPPWQLGVHELLRFKFDFLAYLEGGATFTLAAKMIGQTMKYMANVLEKGKLYPDSEFAKFRADVIKAMAKNEYKAVSAIHQAGTDGVTMENTRTVSRGGQVVEVINTKQTLKDWKASAWYLEHRYPARWNQNYKQEEKIGESITDAYRSLLAQLNGTAPVQQEQPQNEEDNEEDLNS